MKRSCQAFAEARSAYVDGHLGEGERQALLRHLSDCSACRCEVAALQRLRSLLTDNGRGRPEPVPMELANRLAAIAAEPHPSHRNRTLTTSAAAVLLALALITGVGYLAAPAQPGGVADPTASVRTDFAATVAQLPLTNEAVAAALSVDPRALRDNRVGVPSDPTMTGDALDQDRISAILAKASWARSRVPHAGVVRVLAPRDDRTTAADVAVSFVPGSGNSVRVRSIKGEQLAQGLIPTPAASRLAGSAELIQALRAGYRLSGTDGGTLLGRPVSLIEARHPGARDADIPAARWWIDNRTGLVLRQQNYDHAGRLVLSAGYNSVRIGAVADGADSAADDPNRSDELAAGGPGLSGLAAQRPLAAWSTTAAFTTSSAGQLSEQGWFCHSELAGLSLVRLRADASAEPGVLHMVYTDGLSTVSVFERRGSLARPPAESEWDPALGAYRDDAMLNTATWQSSDAVFTVATDGSTALRDRVLAALPHDRPVDRTTMERVGAGWAHIFDHAHS
ncbi:zf-HC2 domain-containing protein [Microlunatus soli]|uniref:Transmembrane transcriptional regulator (Anti-sigma factor RsiW) n=1 Tax=Microlunatus soli TaxID=630515 RepID=A0A1H1Q799_9ACTN|nr:zf-HC2 domain-containing protein [Microlunatus soli]SDS19306.1 Transmembrane transcriptional regulator (anti-sigma factor RsiW) [Microlunatus soli]